MRKPPATLFLLCLGAALLWTCAEPPEPTDVAAIDEPAETEPSEDPRYVVASAEEIAEERSFLLEVAKIEPDPEKWELIETREPLDLSAPRLNYDPDFDKLAADEVLEEEDAAERAAPSVDLAIMGLADGRVYRQKPGTILEGRKLASTTSANQAETRELTESEGEIDLDEPEEGEAPRQLVGADDRRRSTTSTKTEVMVRLQSTSTANWGFCSGSMIGPRVILTAAHCVTDSDGDWDYTTTYVAPGARGASYSGTRRPQGARRVTRYIKPSGWSGGGPKYDYALLVIGDYAEDTSGSTRWTPDWVLFGYQTNSWLESKNFNLRGYPAGWESCADAASGDGGQCNGYAYYHDPARKIDDATSTMMKYKHDTQGGQSGAPVYYYSGGVRTQYGVHKGAYGSRNRSHKIRSGSFGLMCDVIEDYKSSHFPDPYCP